MITSNFRVLAISISLVLPNLALAGDDLGPLNGAQGVEIYNTSGEQEMWYPLSPGQSLNYALTGPSRVWLYVRSGASPRSGVWNFNVEAELSISVGDRVVEQLPQVPALDGFGGLETDDNFPWIARGVLMDIPEGHNSVEIEAALSGPPLLLRVVSAGQSAEVADDEPEMVIIEEETPAVVEVELDDEGATGTILDLLIEAPEETEETTESIFENQSADEELGLDEELAQIDAGGELSEDFEQPLEGYALETIEADDEPTILDLLAVEDDLIASPDEFEGYVFGDDIETDELDTTFGLQLLDDDYGTSLDEDEDALIDDIPDAQSLGTLKERFITSLQAVQVGGSLGLGAPLRGDSPAPYIGAAARIALMPILWDGWNLDWGELYSQVNIGWYRVGVNSDFVINDVHAGPTELTIQYATSVVPMELSVGLEMPFAIGPVVPIAALGTGLYLSTRADEDGSQFDASSGYSALVGGEMELWSGVVGIALSHTGTSGSLGRLDESGNQANEKLSVERLDLTYLTQF